MNLGGNTMQNPVLTIPQAAEYLNLPVSKVYELVRSKDFPAAKIGKNWRIHRERLDQWFLEKLAEKS
jgi:excisionase family DNA binding protein